MKAITNFAGACLLTLLVSVCCNVYAQEMIGPERAEQRNKEITVADCTPGKGCSCTLSRATIGEMEFIWQEAAPENAENMVLVFAPGEPFYYWSPRSLTEIHRSYGGRGRCELELFPENNSPRDGIWEFRDQPVDLSNCPLLTSGIVPGAALPEGPEMGRKAIRWGGRFDPKKYLDPVAHPYWHPIDSHNWKMTLPELSKLPAGGPLTLIIDHKVTLVDQHNLRGYMHYVSQFKFPGEVGAILRNARCNMTKTFTGRWVAPLPGDVDTDAPGIDLFGDD